MEVQVFSFVVAVCGVIFTVWIFRKNAKEVGKERMDALKEQVTSRGGEVVAIEEVDRSGCPYSDEFTSPDVMYKFYRVRYEVDDRRKLGYGILTLKHNNFGPSLAAKSEWIWRF